MSQIIPTAEPYLFPGNDIGCLVVHGFTGTPKEMRSIGEYLAKQGYSVLGPRLTGHATQPEDMIRSRWTDWAASVEDGYRFLRGVASNIYLIGLSMGGVLSLLMSTWLDVKGVVALSTPYLLPVDYPAWMFNLVSLVMPYRMKVNEPPGSSWFDKEAYWEQVSYPKNPVRSIGELSKLLAEMRLALPRVNVPVMLMHSKDDKYVAPENMELIYEQMVKVPLKRKLYITGSGHILPRDAARQQVFESTVEFIRSIEGHT